MIGVRRFAIILTALIGSPAIAADQFDLICTGTVSEKPRGRLQPAAAHYRIDLATKRWCRDDCKTVQTIQSVEPGKIVFSQHEPAYEKDDYRRHSVDRVTGEWSDVLIGAGLFDPYWDYKGKCTPAPFSGLAAVQF